MEIINEAIGMVFFFFFAVALWICLLFRTKIQVDFNGQDKEIIV